MEVADRRNKTIISRPIETCTKTYRLSCGGTPFLVLNRFNVGSDTEASRRRFLGLETPPNRPRL